MQILIHVSLVIAFVAISSGKVLTRADMKAEGKALVEKLEIEFEAEEIENISTDDERKNQHQQFFDQLTEIEKDWVLRLAIAHEGVQRSNSSRPERVNGQYQAKPTPTDYYHMIPETVMEMMLNGEISQKFQEELVKWLKTDLGYTSQDFEQYELNSSEFCQGGEGGGCMSLLSLGGICCPFG